MFCYAAAPARSRARTHLARPYHQRSFGRWAQAQHHPWLNNHDSSGGGQTLSKGALSNLINFRNTNALKKLALELVARSLDIEQIRDLEKDFAKVCVTRVCVCVCVCLFNPPSPMPFLCSVFAVSHTYLRRN